VPPVVGTVEDFQGKEARCVFVSTVRSRSRWLSFDERFNLGLLFNRKRFVNVLQGGVRAREQAG